MGRHIDHTLNSIRAQGQMPIVVKAVARTWYFLASNKGKKLLLPADSAEGIQLFHYSLRVIRVLIETISEPDEQKYMIFKIIRPSLSERYANFDVMELYGDPSLDEMLAIFFQILANWEFSIICVLKKGVRIILETFEAILASRPEKLDDTRLGVVTQFIARTLLWHGDAKFEVKWGQNQNCFRLACECLQTLMLFCLGRTGVDWAIFRPHFVAIADQLFHPTHPIADTVAGPLCYVAKMDSEFVHSVFQAVYASFDEEYRGEIQAIVQRAFEAIDRVESIDQLQRFRYALNGFQKDIMRFAIMLSQIPGFIEFFSI
jgi:hypothetical protein